MSPSAEIGIGRFLSHAIAKIFSFSEPIMVRSADREAVVLKRLGILK